MAESADTPLMRQYLEIKSGYPDAIVFFRLGDFYEMFFDDAVVASQALELTLTSRDKNKADPVPMCGVPHHAAKGYVRRLLDLGHKVAICEQVEDPKSARGVVRREVTEVVTPGVVLDTDHLDAKTNNFLVALSAGRASRIGIAALDLSTFEVRATEVASVAEAADELARLAPKEVVHPAAAAAQLEPLRQLAGGLWQAAADELLLGQRAAAKLVAERAGAAPAELGLTGSKQALRAVALALGYAEATQPARGVPRCRLSVYRAGDHLQLDEPTINNLEVFCSAMERTRAGSLLGVVDGTLTAMGGRLLRRMLAMPLREVAAIRRRHDAVELLVGHPAARDELRQLLRQVYDLERLTSRTVMGMATPRELQRLGRSLGLLPRIVAILGEAARCTVGHEPPELLAWAAREGRAGVDSARLAEIAARVDGALVDDAPSKAGEGGLFRRGVDANLDELVGLCDGGKGAIVAMEAELRQRTGIGSLKIRFNRVFGYFIEVTKANLAAVPEDFQRKQTLANVERFVTAELADYEAKVLGAEERRNALELSLYEELRRDVAAEAGVITAAAEWCAMVDVCCGFAERAQQHDYVRPVVDDSSVIEIEEGRHPVVERFMAAGQFVPNSVRIDDEQRMLILTGPNMSGKSTIMRQVALITLLAQTGSFVPARGARIGVVDRLFTRVGASDNLARGESTFMVEMRETASILAGASERSLVVLDEIGRGTATYDGISIAWAVAEHLHDRVGARTMFATHYHELCQLTEVKPRARNYSVAVQQWQGRIVFLRKLVPGGSSRSYGIEVARLARLPDGVLRRARQVLAALEGGEVVADVPLRGRTQPADQLEIFGNTEEPTPSPSRVERELAAVEIEKMTPLAALNLLANLVARIKADDRQN